MRGVYRGLSTNQVQSGKCDCRSCGTLLRRNLAPQPPSTSGEATAAAFFSTKIGTKTNTYVLPETGGTCSVMCQIFVFTVVSEAYQVRDLALAHSHQDLREQRGRDRLCFVESVRALCLRLRRGLWRRAEFAAQRCAS